MDILISLAGKIVELTVQPIGRQVQYLLCYKNNIKELKEEIKELQTMTERIDHEVEAERRNGRDIQKDVLKWREGVIETIGEVEKLCGDEPHASLQCWKWSFPNLKARHQLGRKAKKMANGIVEMKGKRNFDKGVGYDRQLDITKNFSAPRGSDELESRNSVKEAVILSLKDPMVSKIGVYGIGGVGKTTLVKQVAKQVKECNLFDTVVMLTISQTDLERIQDEIAEQLELHTLKGITSSIGRASCLCDRIKKEKTILIILDDLRGKIDLEKLGIPCFDTQGSVKSDKIGVSLNDDYKGCKLLFTSRTRDTLQKNDIEKTFSLQVLNDTESWNLFQDMVGDVVEDDEFRTVATQVAARCAGLPVLIVTIAKSLKGKEIYYWNDTLSNLKSVENKDMQETLYSALKFNFDRLEDEVQEVFLLYGVLGIPMDASSLLKYVIGLGIFKRSTTVEDARNRLYSIIDDLRASCLFLDGDEKTEMIRMHDRVREVAILIASNVFTRSNAKWQNDGLGKDFLKSCTHIILDRCLIQKLPEKLDCPCLKFLGIYSFDNRTLEIPDSFFTGMRNLEVVQLTCFIISSLPTSLRSLSKLKTLCLDLCYLKDMTGIGDLINLEILSLADSSIREFPSEIGKLTKLRMLDLSVSKIETAQLNILSKLTKIEELYMGGATISWEVVSSTKKKRNASSVVNLGHLKCLTALEIQVPEASLLPKDMPFEKLGRYKVVIGDKWEWPDNEENLRLVKVKLLDINIRSERGIQALIKRVEDLHLDEISGISNVIFDLNGEGFPFLKHLYIQNNGEIQQIINSRERNQTHILFPKLEALILDNLKNLVKICHGPIRNGSFGKLKVIKVKSCGQLAYLFSASLVKAFHQLVEIEVSECNSMKKIVFAEDANNGNVTDEKIEFISLRSLTLQCLPIIDNFFSQELTSSHRTGHNSLTANIPMPFFSAQVKFFYLETLKLSSVNLEKIWDDDQASTPYSVQNLANLTVEDCSGLKYLFSSSVVGKFSNLKQLEISKCDMMEEIIATEETNGTALVLGEVLFPKLESIRVEDMQSLKMLWNVILASNSSLPCFKTLKVNNCEKIENIFPEYMNRAVFASLETVEIKDCKLVREIFKLGANNNENDSSKLKHITLRRLPQLKQIWSTDPQSRVQFKDIRVVCVENCEVLEYLIPFSIAMNLPLLEQIEITGSKRIKEIVSKTEEPFDDPVKFEFNQLTSLVLWSLQDLQGFCSKNHSLSCPSLEILNVWDCKKFKLFKTPGASSQGRSFEDNLHVSMQQSHFTGEEVVGNLKQLILSNDGVRNILQEPFSRKHFSKLESLSLHNIKDDQITSPYWVLQDIRSLEQLKILRCPFKEIFPGGETMDLEGKYENRTQIKSLYLSELHKLQHICKEGCQIDQVLEVLERLDVTECSSLKHLVPSSVTFDHLTCLKVQRCKGMIHLIASSTATSLVQLKKLKIRECNSMEKIVAEETENEIAFNSLEVLELDSLPKLKMFCSGSTNCCLKLPMLERLVIRQCARMDSFTARETSAPMLQKILTDEQDGIWQCWEGSLNKTVIKMFQDKVAFYSFEHLELSQYGELKELWYNHDVRPGMFCNLKNLVVKDCDFLSNVLLPLNLLHGLPNLEEVDVNKCDSLEAIFDLTNGIEAASLSHLPCLKEITLLKLPKLEQIWIIDPQSSVQFKDLQVVRVENCEVLQYLFPFSIAMNLPVLEQITIKGSKRIKEIVSKTEEPFDEPVKFEFNKLTSLELWSLPDLQGFCSVNHRLSCVSLKKLDVWDCQKLDLFKTRGTSSQGRPCDDDNVHVTIQQTYHPPQEVVGNLEQLMLSSDGVRNILQGKFSGKHFGKLKHLNFYGIEDDQVAFLYWFLQDINSLGYLTMMRCPFKEIFLEDATMDLKRKIENRAQIKSLFLSELHELQHICKEGYQIDQVLQVLDRLHVKRCPKLKHLVPSSVTFGHLTDLEVERCEWMTHLIASSTATSLVQLKTLKIRECNSMEQIVAEDLGGGEKENEIAFNSLEVLHLDSLPKLTMFCSGGANCGLKLPVLERLVIKQCARMDSFSARETRAPMLQKILTDEQNGIWYWNGDLNRTVNKMLQDKVAFFSFEHLELSQYGELKELWYNHDVRPGMFCNLKNLVVKDCDFLSNVLLPLNLLHGLPNLVEVDVSECDSLEAILDLTNGIEATSLSHLPCLKKITLLKLPKLKQIWIIDPQSSVQFKDLQVVRVEKCEVLEYLFPFSIAMNLPVLEQITIKSSKRIKEIVSKTGELFGEPVKFEFNKLTSLELWSLPDLQGFCSVNHHLSCASLKKLDVWECEKLKLFKTRGKNSQGRPFDDDNVHVSIQRPYFPPQEVIGNLEQLILSSDGVRNILQEQFSGKHFGKLKFLNFHHIEDDQMTFPYWFLQDINNLEQLSMWRCPFKEIFLEEATMDVERKIENRPQIKTLYLSELDELQHICKGCQIDQVLQVLDWLYVDRCPSLKHLVPSPVTFGHLTYLKVERCEGMIHLIASSTATSLVLLKTLMIRECNSMEKIVAEETENEIAFNGLEVLKLDSLPKLKMFCSGSTNCCLKLPVLERLVIRQCPRMDSFTSRDTRAPILQKILTDEQSGIWYWEGDLTRTVNKMFQDKVALNSYNRLELSEYPELIELWYGQVICHQIFCNLRHLVVLKCSFLSNTLFSSNQLQLLHTLEELEVAECDSLEAIFDVKALDDKAIESTEVSGLKKLTLSKLQNLKLIWTKEVEEIISFRNLQIVKVDKCQHLKYLFSVSLCHDLSQLEMLLVESCDGVEEIVSSEEGVNELKFDFPRLTTLVLFNLTHITNFYPRRYILECPSLKSLNVRGCDELQIFAFDHLNPQLLGEGNIELQNKQALFFIERVSQNLEVLPLNEKDTMRILKSAYGKDLFHSVNTLVLQYFCETPMKFLNELIQKFPATTTLKVRCGSSFEILFPSQEIGHCSIGSPIQIKNLWLYQLEQLEHIWSDDNSAPHPLIPNLEDLFIEGCPRLRRLAPPLTCFTNLTNLIVEDCNGLMYFMSSFAAKTLVHLTWLRVRNCDMLEEIVMTGEGESSEEEIIFKSLEYLELICLSSFKSFCFGKHTFIFPSLMRFKVTGCHKMQIFSSGVLVAPSLKSIEVENGKRRWKENLNTTVKQLFIDKESEGAEGDNIEYSGIIQNSQNSVGTSRVLSFEKQEIQNVLNILHTGSDTPKLCDIVESPLDQVDADMGTKEMLQTIPIEDMSIPVSSQDIATETHVKYEKSIDKSSVAQATQEAWDITIVHDRESHDSGIHLSKNLFNLTTTSSMAADYKEPTVGTQEKYESKRSFSVVLDAQNILEKPDEPQIILGNSVMEENIAGEAVNLSIQDDEDTVATEEMHEDRLPPSLEVQGIAAGTHVRHDSVQASSNATPSSTTRVSEIDNKEGENDGISNLKAQIESMKKELLASMQESLALILRDKAQGSIISSSSEVQVHETIQKPLVQNVEQVSIPASPVGDKEESHDSYVHLSKNLFNHPSGNNETVGTQETHNEFKRRSSLSDAQNVLSPTTVYNTGKSHAEIISENLSSQVTNSENDENEAKSHDSNIHLSKNLFNLTTTSSSAAAYKEPTVGTQEKYESKRSFSVVLDAQNILEKPDEPQITLGNSVMEENIAGGIDPSHSHHDLEAVNSPIQDDEATDPPLSHEDLEAVDSPIQDDEAIDPSLTHQDLEAVASSIQDEAPSLASNEASLPTSLATVAGICTRFKELDVSVQLLPYLEAGVKRHPQVLNWLNTKQRRRVFASSYFSLFAEVTRILRTIRRVDLTEDDQNYIKECCAVLQGVGFDKGWISYVHGRIQKCGDKEDLEWKVDEAEAQIESLKKELASVQESSRGYIYLSTLINALLFTVLFFIIMYVYQKKN